MSGRHRRRALWWVAIVLPGFLLRSLIPIGFMPMFGPGLHVSLMLCEGYAPLPSGPARMSIDMPMDMPMDLPMDPSQGRGAPPHNHSDHQDHSTCSYGAGPTLAAMPMWTTPSLRVQRPPDPRALEPQVTTFELFPRAQFPRGPPIEV